MKQEIEGEITNIKLVKDPPWTIAIMFIKCGEFFGIRVDRTFSKDEEIPKKGDRVKLRMGKHFWEIIKSIL